MTLKSLKNIALILGQDTMSNGISFIKTSSTVSQTTWGFLLPWCFEGHFSVAPLHYISCFNLHWVLLKQCYMYPLLLMLSCVPESNFECEGPYFICCALLYSSVQFVCAHFICSILYLPVIIKVKLTLCLNAIWWRNVGTEGNVTCIVHFSTKVSGQHHDVSTLPCNRGCSTHWRGGWVGEV
jgi:hypothetical protein